ncbi:MAG: DNA translocase FtsK [Allorhizobium sp.]
MLDPEKLPVWQRAFVLGPNVRFTRTPGAVGLKREAELSSQDAAATFENDVTVTGNYIIGRGNPSFPSVPTSPVGELQRQLGAALQRTPEQNVIDHATSAAEAQAAILRTILPPRTGSPLRVPPRPAAVQRLPAVAQAMMGGHTPPMAASLAPATGAPTLTPTTNPLPQMAHPKPPAPVTASPAGPAVSTAPVAQRRIAAAIPDHLLWEMMSLGSSDHTGMRPVVRVPEPVRPAVAAVPFAAPVQRAAATTPPIAASLAKTETTTVLAVPPYVPPHIPPAGPSAVHLYRQVTLRSEAAAEVVAPVAEDVAAVVETVAPAAIPTPARLTRLAAKHAPGLLSFVQTEDYLFPDVDLLQAAAPCLTGVMSQEALEQSAGLLESILEDFGVKGEIIDVRPGPVVTLYEFEPAPGVKSSRIINLSDDIARSMSALSARVAVVPGRNVIGIELPNAERETVYLRELFESDSYVGTDHRLPLCLGKTIGGEPVIADLARMPHLLVAGTTGSGKSVAINTMILSLIYHLRPEECRLIMVDPKMLELSAYDGIPHLLTPVVTDAKKAVLALKWAVREMEERYRKMSRLGVRNIDGFNARVAQARASDEKIMLNVPYGFDRTTGEQLFEEQELDLTALPFIVVIVDEMADLMMVAGKEIEGAIQRLAQMARAAGIHLIMATQRPSVDVITGTIKANFPTRISFQVTSKIDSRTILGEQGAEHLLGQGDMLHMVGGGRIARVHGPFVSDREVEKIVAHLKTQGQPDYLGSVTEDTVDGAAEEDTAVFDDTAMGGATEGDELYERAIKVVQRDKKCSTSYIQRRLSIGYNRAASLVERMEHDGLVGAPNHVGKREILGQRPIETREIDHEAE